MSFNEYELATVVVSELSPCVAAVCRLSRYYCAILGKSVYRDREKVLQNLDDKFIIILSGIHYNRFEKVLSGICREALRVFDLLGY